MKKYILLFVSSLILLSFCNCSNKKDAVQGMKNPPKHVVLVGFDGLSAYSLNHNAEMPMFRKLMAGGAYTLKNRSVLPSSSAVNWASIFMGAGPEIHGFTTWGSQTPDLPSRVLTPNGLFPDIYYGLRSAYPNAELGYFYEWGGMKYLVDTLSINRVEQADLSVEDNHKALDRAITYLKTKKPMFSSFIFAEPDGVGHRKGWESDEYFAKLTNLDHALQEIVEALKAADMMDETIIILASDHGGKDHGHGGKTMKEMQTPIVFYGKGIKKGTVIKESTMDYDIAGTIGYIFGLTQPQAWIARPIKSVFN